MNWIEWKDQINEFEGRFKESTNSDGSITHTPVKGRVMQAGTLQNAANFNTMMDGIIDAHVAIGILANAVHQNAWEIERGSIELKNTLTYPFNDSVKSVDLKMPKENGDYIVLCDVGKSVGNVGEVVVSDKLRNGFKVGYTGSAPSATINYTVIGGLMK